MVAGSSPAGPTLSFSGRYRTSPALSARYALLAIPLELGWSAPEVCRVLCATGTRTGTRYVDHTGMRSLPHTPPFPSAARGSSPLGPPGASGGASGATPMPRARGVLLGPSALRAASGEGGEGRARLTRARGWDPLARVAPQSVFVKFGCDCTLPTAQGDQDRPRRLWPPVPELPNMLIGFTQTTPAGGVGVDARSPGVPVSCGVLS